MEYLAGLVGLPGAMVLMHWLHMTSRRSNRGLLRVVDWVLTPLYSIGCSFGIPTLAASTISKRHGPVDRYGVVSMPDFKYRQDGSWVQGTLKKRENGSWVSLSGGGGPDIPDDATIVSQDGGTIVGETDDGTQYTGSSLDTVIEDISDDVNGAIAIESGTYDWTGMCTLTNDTHIMGDGEVILDIQSMGNTQVFDLYDVTDNVSFENLIFESDGTTDDAISRREGSTPRKDNLLVRGCEFHGFDGRNSSESDVHVVNADNWYDSVIEHCTFTGVGYSAIRLHAGGEGLICRGNTIDLPPDAQQAIMSDAHQSLIEDNHITLGDASGDPSYGIRIQDQWADFSKDITVKNNTIEAEPGSADSYGFISVTTLLEVLDISGNTFYGHDKAVSGDLPSGTDITSNEFNTCRIGVTSSDSTDINLSDNEFIDCDNDVLL